MRPAMLWNDQRTAEQCAEIETRLGLERLIALTGNRALTGFTAPKLLWLREHEPATYRRIRHVLLPKDYVRYRLEGTLATDAADASGTLLFDVAKRRWSEEVCAELEIPLDWLPPVSESTEVGAAGDQAAAAVGLGIVAPGRVSVVLGTSGVVFAPLPAYRPDREARVHVFCHAAPGHLARDGRHAQRRRLAGLAPADPRTGSRDLCGRGGTLARRAARVSSLLPISPANARPTPIPTRAAPSSASRCGTTAAHSCGRRWRASPTGSETRSSS